MHDFEKLWTECHRQVEAKYKPFARLVEVIVRGAAKCRDASKILIKAQTEQERMEREIYIFYEFIYFFMHMAMRHSFALLSADRLREVQEYSGPFLASVAIDSYFRHWPDELKQKMTSEFFDKLNQSELEYSECTQFQVPGSEEERLKAKLRALFTQLASNIAGLAVDDSDSMPVMLRVTAVTIEEWKKMCVEQLVQEIAKTPKDIEI